MNRISVQDDADLIDKVNTWLKHALANLHETPKIIQLPAGNTPLAIYKSWEQNRPDFLNEALFQQVDDIITGPKSGCFELFFSENLTSYRKQFVPLISTPITPHIAILGVGPNGHLAFHEPEINFDFNYGCVRLSAMTCENLKTPEPTWGLTYGAGHFMKCASLLIIVKGQNKKLILEKALTEKVPSSPFSHILKLHPNCTLLIDQIIL